MGLFLRYNLFANTTAAAVYGCYTSFYAKRGRPLDRIGDERDRIEFHNEENRWVVVNLDRGWEWKERREVQQFVSQRLWCPGFLVFVYDGDYWGYEFFLHGTPLDHFVQEATGQPVGFPGEDCHGNPQVIAEHLPWLRVEDVAPYLVQKHDWVIPEGADVPARPGDEFRRFDECSVVDFLRMLGIAVEVRDQYVRLRSSVYRSAFKRR
jgi:hypothetical protein